MPGPLKRPREKPIQIPQNWEHPPCPACDGPVERREGETVREWHGRVCCTTKCGGRMGTKERARVSEEQFAAAEAAHAPCAICQGPVPRRVGQSRESISRYQERQTCQKPACREVHRKQVADRQAAQYAAMREEREIAKASQPPPPPPVAPHGGMVREEQPIDFHGGFAKHNLVFKPPLGRVSSRPFQQSFGVSAAWAVRGG